MHRVVFTVSCLALFIAAILAAGCGSSSNTTQMGIVNLRISDPPTCSAPRGPYRHVFVTVTDVKIHTSSDAGANDSGFTDLTPNLKNNPQQVDLLAQASTECFLATLGSTIQIPSGTFQQIRVFLAADGTSIANNQCASAPGNVANCVVLTSDGSVHDLQLSSEAQSGLKIPSGQIAGGGFTINSGQTKDLDIDFNACASIVAAGNGEFLLKPVLHAGEVGLSSAINGSVVDSATGKTVVGGTTVVALERKDASGIDRVVMSTLADANGNFVLCPVPTGTFDLVIAAVNGAGVFYAPSVTTGLQNSTAVGQISITAEPSTGNTGPASLTGVVQTAGASGAVPEIVVVSALQTVAINGSNVQVTIPLAQKALATINLTTASGASCAAGTDCVSYTLAVPGVNAFVGAFSSSGTKYTQAAGNVTYNADGQPIPRADNTPICTQTDVQGPAVNVTPGPTFPAGTLSFTGCS